MERSHVAEDDASEFVHLLRRQRFAVAICICLVSLALVIWRILVGDSCSPDILGFASLGALGPLAPAAKEQRSIKRISSRVAWEPLLEHIREILWIGLQALHARRLVLTLSNQQTGERIQWKTAFDTGLFVQTSSRSNTKLLSPLPDVCAAMFVRSAKGTRSMGVNWNGRPVESSRLRRLLPGSWNEPFQVLMLGWFQLGEQWMGSFAYLDAALSACPGDDWKTWIRIVNAIRSSVSLFGKDDATARMEERKQLASDLHDGVAQSIIATEMQIALLARQKCSAGAHGDTVLNTARDILREEIRKLRKKIEELETGEILTPLESAIRQSLLELEEETGIKATFECEINHERIPKSVVSEVSYVLQAALSNVLRHSGASCVNVCLRVADGIHLDIQDNGCGFDFSGRYDLAALTVMKVGPRTICKRVEASGGRMILESNRDQGVRLELWIPFEMPEKGPEPHAVEAIRPTGQRPPHSITGPRNLWRVS